MDTAIAIRTAVVKDGMLYVQAGAGIVHDSVPETEWQETLSKARAVLRKHFGRAECVFPATQPVSREFAHSFGRGAQQLHREGDL